MGVSSASLSLSPQRTIVSLWIGLTSVYTIVLSSIRGGIGATLGAVGAQLPYPYVHLVYWTIQIVLVALSIETGVILAANTYFMKNGTWVQWASGVALCKRMCW